MDDRTITLSDKDFIAAMVERAYHFAQEGKEGEGLLRAWAALCDLPLPENIDAAFWDGFILGGAIVGLDIAEFKLSSRGLDSSALRAVKGGKGESE